MSYFGAALTPPRTSELWPKLTTRLGSTRMNTVLGGEGRIYMATDELDPEGGLSSAWGRVVIAPVQLAFGEGDDQPGRIRVVPFLVRSEFNHPGGSHNVSIPNDAAQSEAFDLLHGWTPEGFTYARPTSPLFRQTQPQAYPLWDALAGVWFSSAEYRAILAPPHPDEE